MMIAHEMFDRMSPTRVTTHITSCTMKSASSSSDILYKINFLYWRSTYFQQSKTLWVLQVPVQFTRSADFQPESRKIHPGFTLGEEWRNMSKIVIGKIVLEVLRSWTANGRLGKVLNWDVRNTVIELLALHLSLLLHFSNNGTIIDYCMALRTKSSYSFRISFFCLYWWLASINRLKRRSFWRWYRSKFSARSSYFNRVFSRLISFFIWFSTWYGM